MKTSKFLFVAAFAASLLSCQNDTFDSNNANSNEGLKGKLVKSGLLGVGYGAGNAETRAYSVDGRFIWMPTVLNADGSIGADPITGAARSNQRIGFCWTGINNENPEYSAATSLSQKVYTNYEFEHVGWLAKNATKVEREECAPFALTNGGYIVGETINGDVAKWQSAPYESANGRGTNYQTTDDGRYAIGEYANGELNLGSGLFKTENSDVFEGEYLVYFPYNNGFTRGQILAAQPDHFDIDVNLNRFTTLSRYAFSIGRVNHYAGGQSLEKISTRTLSSFTGVKLYNSASGENKIKKVIFYANETGFLFEQDLDAKACVEAIMNGKPLGEDIYYNGGTTTVKKNDTNAIYATLSNDGTEYATVSASTNGNVENALKVYFPVLPQTVKDLTVVLINDQDKTYVYEAGTVKFESGKDNTIKIDLSGANFESKYMVVDEETLFSALENIKLNGSEENTIQLLRSVRIEDVMSHTPYVGDYGTIFFNKNIDIMTLCKPNAKGEEVGLSLAAGQELYIKSQDATGKAKLTINVPFTVEGAGCCDTDVARLSVGSTQSGIADIEFTKIINNGALALANIATKKATITVGELVNAYDEWALDKEKTNDAAQLFLLGDTESDIQIGTLTNKGTVTASPVTVGKPACYVSGAEKNKDSWKAYVDEAISALNKSSFDHRPVKATIGTLTNEVSTTANNATLEGGVINIEGFAELVVNALTNISETAIIKTLNVTDGEANSTLDGRLTLKGASTNNGIIDNNGVTNLEGQPMQNNGLLIDQLSGQLGGQYIENGKGTGLSRTYGSLQYKTDLPVKGMYVSKVATNQRLNFTLTDEVTSASVNVIEIVGSDVAFFNLENVDPNNLLKDKDVYVAAEAKQIAFKAFDSANNATAKSFGHCVTVRSNSILNVKDGLLSTVKDVNVEENASFKVDSKYTADKSEITIGGNLNNAGTTTHKADILTVKKDLNNEAAASFTSDNSFVVEGNVETAGTFDSNGTPNTVAGNFDQTAGNTTFAYKTTTTVDGQFSCAKGASFLREALGTSDDYRATVNVGGLGKLEGNNNGGGWPTVKRN